MNSCRLCGSQTDFTQLAMEIERGNNYLQKCNHCGSIFTKIKTPPEQVHQIYDELFSGGAYDINLKEYERVKANGRTGFNYRKYLFNKIHKQLSGKRIIEIGGGFGVFGYYVSKKGFSYFDYDISDVAVSLVAQLGLNAAIFPEENLPPIGKKSADLVVMWEVLEHVWDVVGYLETLYNAMDYGGILLLSTPNLHRSGYLESLSNQGLSSPPIHINFFSEDSLTLCLKAAGFKQISFYHRKIEYPRKSVKDFFHTLKIMAGFEAEKTLYCAASR